MIAFSPDGFYSAGMVLLCWAAADSSTPIGIAGVLAVALSFWGDFFHQFDRP